MFFILKKLRQRCPNGYHKSPSGDCERVVSHEGTLPRCPNGFHRSPDGDCERVSDNNSNDGNNNNEGQLSDIPSENDKDTTTNRFPSSGTTASIPPSPSVVTASESTPGKCDDSLWNHVYNPSRLEIVDKCITVTGIIDSIRYGCIVDVVTKNAGSQQVSEIDNRSLVEFWKQVYGIEISPDEIPLLKVKMMNSENVFTYPPSMCFFGNDSLLNYANVQKFIENKKYTLVLV